ncbi:MAG: 8-amino-7-oxononanoate synthase [Gilvibacter sp.]
MKFPEHLLKKLEARKKEDAFRVLTDASKGIDFSSNDYLGLATQSELYNKAHRRLLARKNHKSGAGGSRLLTGNHNLYIQAEALIAQVHKSEAALVFPSGYMANLGLIAAIANRECVILYDSLCHASIREAIGFSKAKSFKFSHNDLDHLEKLINKYQSEGKSLFVITESVFSMDGDSPDLLALASLCKRYGCYCILDEAHAVGVFGESGQGLAAALKIEDAFFARIVTFGKALGSHGAAVLGSKQLVEYLINFSRPLIYTTGMSPISVATILEAYEWIQNSPEYIDERKKLHRNIALLRLNIVKYGLEDSFIKSDSAIHCCLVPGNSKAKAMANTIQRNGFDVRAILAPTVPKGHERLRICLHSYNSEEQINTLVKLLSQTYSAHVVE